MMASGALFTTVLRMGLLTSDEASAAGILLSSRERPLFDRDPIAFYLRGAGPTRRKQIEALVSPSNSTATDLRDVA